MPNPIFDIFARLRARDETRRGIESAKRQFQGLAQRIKGWFGPAAGLSLFAGLHIGLGAVRRLRESVGWIVEVNRETQSLQASLATVTGSTAAANRAFRDLDQFARETPFQIEELARAFVRMQALGLDPSREALESYGNTASAFSTSLLQFVEAVADAASGEFERLKEFGIRARAEGETIKFVFRDGVREVRNTAADIEAYLRGIGDIHFGGAMERQMDTLVGASSNLSDNLGRFARAIGEGGLNRSIQDFAVSLSDLLEVARPLATALGVIGSAIVNLGAAPLKIVDAYFGAIDLADLAERRKAVAIELGLLIEGDRKRSERLAATGGSVGARQEESYRRRFEGRKETLLAELVELNQQMEDLQAEVRSRVLTEEDRVAQLRHPFVVRRRRLDANTDDGAPTQTRTLADAIADIRQRLKGELEYRSILGDSSKEIAYRVSLLDRELYVQELLNDAADAGLRARIREGESMADFHLRVTPAERELLEQVAVEKARQDEDEANSARQRASELFDRLRSEAHDRRMNEFQREASAIHRWRDDYLAAAEAAGRSSADVTGWAQQEAQRRIGIAREEFEERRRILQEEAALETRRRALAQSDSPQDGIREGLRRLTADTRSAAQEWADVTEAAAQRMSASLTDFVTRGRLNFSSLVDYVIQESTRIAVVDPLVRGLLGAIGLGGGGGGFAVPTYDIGGMPIPTAHGGGIVGQGALRWPRYHRGGLASDEVPAILQRREGVFTAEQMRALAPVGSAAPQVTVEVINRGPALRVEQTEQRIEAGRAVISVVVADVRRRGDLAQTMEAHYGLRPVVS